ncbi:MAG: efflux RND transporter periplasmic adaptor subunit [Sideroxydans sp.]|nr:efflux RND transporter periplasmic adaptor subunit [Sideroxydans sp.]
MMKTRILDNKPLLIKLMLASLALGGSAMWMMGNSVAEETATAVTGRPALTVRTAVLREDKWAETLSANGSILPWQEAIIGSQLQGVRIAEVKVSIGDQVKRGEVLATLDNAIRREGDGAPQGKILAPDDGVISSTSANVGSMPQPGVELFRLIRKGRLEWRAELTADELMRLRRGMKVRVTLSGGRSLSGTVRAISPSVDARTRYGYALVALDDSSDVIAGAFARGTLDIKGMRKVQYLPATAIMQRGDLTYVLAVDAAGRVHERAVKTGQRKGARVEIVQGLKSGEAVVESGGPFLTEGDLVQVVKE